MIKGVLGPIAEAWVCACGGSIGAYDNECGGFQARDWLPMCEVCTVAEGVTLGRAPCKDDIEGNCTQGTPTIKHQPKCASTDGIMKIMPLSVFLTLINWHAILSLN